MQFNYISDSGYLHVMNTVHGYLIAHLIIF